MPVLQELGWEVFNSADIVIPDFRFEGRQVDFALCHPAKRPVVFVEVTNAGQLEGPTKQLLEYAFHSGVPMAVLTDGREWTFFLPGEQGSNERSVCNIHLLERDVEDSAHHLERYLSYERVCSGEALTAAQLDYQSVVRARQIQDALPKAWRILLRDPDSLIVDLLAEKYEELNGYRPDLDPCRKFLINQTKTIISAPLSTPEAPTSSHEQSSSDSERPRDSELVRLSELAPIPSAKPEPPRSLLWPDGAERQITKWAHLFVEIAEWLISRRMVTAEACPIQLTRGRRYHIHHTSVHLDGTTFRSSIRLSNGLYLYTHESSAGLVRHSNSLLRKFDQDPAQFFVRFR